MTRRWSLLAVLAAGLLLPGCSPPPAPAATVAAHTAQAAAPAATPVTASSPTAAVASSQPPLGSDQSYLEDLRQHNNDAVTARDVSLTTMGTMFCTQLRAGIPAKWEMTDQIKKISGSYLSGRITEAQETQEVLDLADIDRIATKHYCPEQMPQVMAAFAQMAAGY